MNNAILGFPLRQHCMNMFLTQQFLFLRQMQTEQNDSSAHPHCIALSLPINETNINICDPKGLFSKLENWYLWMLKNELDPFYITLICTRLSELWLININSNEETAKCFPQ